MECNLTKQDLNLLIEIVTKYRVSKAQSGLEKLYSTGNHKNIINITSELNKINKLEEKLYQMKEIKDDNN